MADDQNDGQEKSLDPTPQKLEKAREKGDIPRSTDVNTFASYLGMLLVMIIAGGSITFQFGEAMSSFLAQPHLMADRMLAPGGQQLLGHYLGAAFLALAPLFVVPALAVLLSLIAQRAIVVAPSKLEPKLSRLSPISNAAQKFGPTGLVEFLKSVVKMTVIAIVVGYIVYIEFERLGSLVMLDARILPQILFEEGLLILGAALVVAAIIAAMDYLWQNYDHMRKLRMSQQELKDEMKNTEGDPYFRQVRRDRAREIAMNRSISEVPKADVVIVNPIHFAVALKWARTPGSAPVVISKGVDVLALRIREIAAENGVPIHEDPPTARLLFDVLEIGDEIAAEHYEAVAVAIRFADTARARVRARGGRLQ